MKLLCSLIWSIIVLSIVQADVILVPSDFPSIQSGIDAGVNGDTILISDGIFSGEGNKNIDFSGKSLLVQSLNGQENCIIDCEEEGRGFYFHSGETRGAVLKGITITGGLVNNAENRFGGGISIVDSSPTVVNCRITGNAASYYGGGIYINGSNPHFINCIIDNNHSWDGGGIYIDSSYRAFFWNCLIVENTVSRYGGGLKAGTRSDTFFGFCTFSNNSALEGGGVYNAILVSRPETYIACSIFWNNLPDEIEIEDGTVVVIYSDIMGGFPGYYNIDADPLFEDDGMGNSYFLSQISAGQTSNSPCLDQYYNQASECCSVSDEMFVYCLNTLTTRTDSDFDSGMADLGFHHGEGIPFVATPTPTLTASPTPSMTPTPTISFTPSMTPTPTITFTPSVTPTCTPTNTNTPVNTPTQTCTSTITPIPTQHQPWQGVHLDLSGNYFSEEDWLRLVSEARGGSQMDSADLVVILEVTGIYWFWPTWTNNFDFQRIELIPFHSTKNLILSFIWPSGISGSASGLKFWGAILKPDTTEVIGTIDSVVFGYY